MVTGSPNIVEINSSKEEEDVKGPTGIMLHDDAHSTLTPTSGENCQTKRGRDFQIIVQWDQSSPGNSASHYSDQSMIKLDFFPHEKS